MWLKNVQRIISEMLDLNDRMNNVHLQQNGFIFLLAEYEVLEKELEYCLADK